ncbi:MAG: hypothetical protein WKF60_01070 [Ilumatobacter sp.]
MIQSMVGLTILLVPMAGAATAGADQADNWHVHNGVEAPVGFFPGMLRQTPEQYGLDPAACPDATDKALLPNGMNGRFLRAGVCMTSTLVIHLRTSPVGAEAPTSFTFLSTIGGFSTYFKLTPR